MKITLYVTKDWANDFIFWPKKPNTKDIEDGISSNRCLGWACEIKFLGILPSLKRMGKKSIRKLTIDIETVK